MITFNSVRGGGEGACRPYERSRAMALALKAVQNRRETSKSTRTVV